MFKLLKPKEATAAVSQEMTLEQVRLELLGLMAHESTNHHRMGQLYNYIVEKRLAEKAGYKDARDYLGKHLADLSQSALTMYGAVAEAFREPVARRFGVTCLYLLLTYKEVADLELNHEDPGGTLIEVPGADGQVTTRPFSACSVGQLREALRRKRKPASSKPLPAEAVALADHYRDTMKDWFPKGVRVKVLLRNQKGKAVLDIKGIPLEEVSQLAEALRAVPGQAE